MTIKKWTGRTLQFRQPEGKNASARRFSSGQDCRQLPVIFALFSTVLNSPLYTGMQLAVKEFIGMTPLPAKKRR